MAAAGASTPVRGHSSGHQQGGDRLPSQAGFLDLDPCLGARLSSQLSLNKNELNKKRDSQSDFPVCSRPGKDFREKGEAGEENLGGNWGSNLPPYDLVVVKTPKIYPALLLKPGS